MEHMKNAYITILVEYLCWFLQYMSACIGKTTIHIATVCLKWYA